MTRQTIIQFSAALLLLLLPSVFNAEAGVVEKDAVRILTTACDFLAKTEKFTMVVELNYDVVQESGQKIEFGGRQEVKIQRPNQARIDMLRRDGSNDTIIYDGKKVILHNQFENVYAEESIAVDLDKVFAFISNELEIPIPLGELLSTNAAKILTEKIVSGTVIGTSVVGTVPTTHLAFQDGSVGYQIWIANGDKPLPQRLVINYNNETGQPKFIAQFLYWNPTPQFDSGTFSFTPPEDAERIPIAVVDLHENTNGGKP